MIKSLVLRVEMVGVERGRAVVPGACLTEGLAGGVETFHDGGVEHRMEQAGAWAGVEFIGFA